MSNVSIFEKKWIDLVFENKNQAYGAYQLRQENPKTTVRAFIYAVISLFSITITGLALSSFGTKDVIDEVPLSTPITLTKLSNPPIFEPIEIPASKPKEIIKDDITRKDLTDNVVVVKTNDNPDEIKNNSEPKSNPNPSENGVVGGVTSDNSVVSKGSDSGFTTSVIPNNTIVTTVSLDEMPEFPGGIHKFYDFIGNNFEKPELESGTILTVYVSFVIEKDGKMTDIKVIRTAGSEMDKEAIRVLKSLKTNWKAGVKDGQKVRTLYTLPIKVKTE